MSDQAPELDGGAGGGGSFLTRRSLGGAPNWLWLVVGVSTVGVGYFLLRRRKAAASSSTPTTATAVQNACTDANGSPVDCNSLLAVNSEGQSQYEQITSQLTGLSGQDAAISSSVGQLSGQVSAIPAGPAGPPGPAGGTGPAGPPGAASTPGPSKPVPNVRGMTFAQAKQTLANAGFNVGGGAVQKNYAPGTIISSQTPGPGTVITYGSQYFGTGSSAPTVDLG